jgi:stalled ribosome rescue protein Dom34
MSPGTVHFHALVWIDHREAKVFHVNAIEAERELIRSSHPTQHLHHKANSSGSGHAALDKHFLEQVSHALAPVGAVLITGPGTAKTELLTYINSHHPDVAKKISGVETLDHPSDGALVALARKFFKADDRMRA